MNPWTPQAVSWKIETSQSIVCMIIWILCRLNNLIGQGWKMEGIKKRDREAVVIEPGGEERGGEMKWPISKLMFCFVGCCRFAG